MHFSPAKILNDLLKRKPTHVSLAHAQDLNVLVAEDAQVTRRIAGVYLERMGVSADFVFDGEEAIQAVRQIRPDIVLMDCQMPRVDGLEATRQIRAWELHESISASERVWIIAMTADTTDGIRDQCRSAGMDDYLPKPFSARDLQAAMSRAPRFQSSERSETKMSARPNLETELNWSETLFAMPTTAAERRQGVDEFVVEVDRDIGELMAAVVRTDPQNARLCAHRLKGAFAMFGLSTLSKKSEQIESTTADGWKDEIPLMVSELAENYFNTIQALQNWVHSETD